MRLLLFLFITSSFPLQALTFVDDPDQCVKNHARPCAIKNLSNKPYRLQLENTEISIGSQGVLWIEEGAVRVVRGECLIMAKQAQKFETAYMKVELQGGIMLVRVFDAVEIDLIEGAGQMWLKGDQVTQDMTPGFHWTVSGMTRRGVASVEIPQASVFKSVVKSWAGLNFADKKDFFGKVERYRQKLVEAVGASSELNQHLAQKMVEDDEAARRLAARNKAQVESENKRLRQLFRHKNDMD